jgi:pimeloyl-ACP methyl ester carboxylesterase
MPETNFTRRWADEGQRLAFWEAGDGETVVAVVGGDGEPTRAHALLAEHRRVVVVAMPTDAGTPLEVARRIGTALAELGIARFDLIGESDGAAAALCIALMPTPEIGSIVLAAPDGPTDETCGGINRPVLLLSGTNDGPDAAARYRAVLPAAHFMLVYDAGPAIGIDRPEALAFIAREFFERRDLFLVSRESGKALA